MLERDKELQLQQLTKAIQAQRQKIDSEIDALATLLTEKELLNKVAPSYPEEGPLVSHQRHVTITQAVLNALAENRYRGLKLDDFERYIIAFGHDFNKPTITATLGRLKRNNRVVRVPGGYWKLLSYANEQEVKGSQS